MDKKKIPLKEKRDERFYFYLLKYLIFNSSLPTLDKQKLWRYSLNKSNVEFSSQFFSADGLNKTEENEA